MWNLESWALESKMQYLKSEIHSIESRIQDCLGCPLTGGNTPLSIHLYILTVLTDSSHHSKGYMKDMRKW